MKDVDMVMIDVDMALKEGNGRSSNAIRTNYIKPQIDNMQQNRKWKLCRERDEAIRYIVSK